MAVFRVRPVTLLEFQPDHSDLGRTLPIAASQTFPAYNIAQVASGAVQAIANNSNTDLGYVFEGAVDPFFKAAGPGNPSAKNQVRLGKLKGVRIGITVQGTWSASIIGAKRPLQTHSSGYATLNATASGTSAHNVFTVIRVYEDMAQVLDGTDSNVYVEAVLDDVACYDL